MFSERDFSMAFFFLYAHFSKPHFPFPLCVNFFFTYCIADLQIAEQFPIFNV